MEFGVVLHVSAEWAKWDAFLNIAREAERLGYDSVWVSDHLISPEGRFYGLESWTVLSALASVTRKIRLGTYVLCNQFRHPSLLAKMASTLDNITGGRLEFGIGAGWFKEEHVAFGFKWEKRLARIGRLRESIAIMKKLWTENRVSYDGKYFRLKDARLEPKPVQKPNPPIFVGGNSEAIRKVVAELGDGWIPVLPTPNQLVSGVAQIKEIMKCKGRNPLGLQVAYGGSGCTVIARNEESVTKMAEPLVRSMGKPAEPLSCIIGTPERCIRKIEQYREAGVRKIVAGFYDFPSLKGLRLFAKSVIPHFK